MDSTRSRYGYIIMYAGCPIYLCSKLATEIALSMTEAEYIGLSQALCTVILLMNIAEELKASGIKIKTTMPMVHCKVFKDNMGVIELATNHKFQPCTRHIAMRYHHFCPHATQGKIKILHIDTALHPADQLTKPVLEDVLRCHRKTIQGWDTEIPCRYTLTRGSKGKLTMDRNLEDDLCKEFDNQSMSMAPTRNGSVSDAKIQDSIK
jgi:hypothetical protein